jgi:hypothetical protein
MSSVTNCILHFSVFEPEDRCLEKVNSFFTEAVGYFGRQPFVSVEDGVYGGDKWLESPIFIGAFNYLNVEALCAHIRSIEFARPASVQLIIQRPEEDRFSIINVFEGPDADQSK